MPEKLERGPTQPVQEENKKEEVKKDQSDQTPSSSLTCLELLAKVKPIPKRRYTK